MADKKNLKQRSFRFEPHVFEWFDKRDLKMQGVVSRLVDRYIQEKETEQQKIINYQK